MADFMIYFLICNIFIGGIICILFPAKKIWGRKLSRRMQYHLGFVLFIFLALPFIPVRRFNLFLWLNTFVGTHSDYATHAITGEISPYILDTSRQIDDFAISISHKTLSIIGYILCLLWFAGILIMLFLAIKSLFQIYRIIKSSLPLQNSAIRNLYYECLKESGIKKKIPIYSTAFLKCPVIIGLLKPRIFLPIHTISNYDSASMRFMLLHELQHFKHKDMAVNYLIIIAEILYWFNPFVWYSLREIKCEREISCDSSVLQMLQETEYEHYGNTLINFAEKISMFPFVTGISGNFKQLQKRILNISAFKEKSSRPKHKNIFTCLLILAVLFVLLSFFPCHTSMQGKYDFNEKDKNITFMDLSSKFDNYKGCFVLYDNYKDMWTIYNREAAVKQITPNSTYKIYDALLGLESGIITPEQSKMTWNGKEYPFDTWESDQTLTSAMHSSVNWYFQRIDNIAGLNNIKSFLQNIRLWKSKNQ